MPKTIKVGDIVKNEKAYWDVVGVYLGSEKKQSVIGLKSSLKFDADSTIKGNGEDRVLQIQKKLNCNTGED